MTSEKPYAAPEKHAAGRTVCFIVLTVMGVLYHLPALRMQGIPQFPNEDTLFHLSRALGFRNVWASPVSFLNFGHHGGMANIFYPWLTLYPLYLMIQVCGSCVLGYKLFGLLLTLATLYLSAWAMFRISGNRFSAVLFALLYSYSAYRFDDLFFRGHMGESICLTVLPLVLLGIYEVFFGDPHDWRLLAVGMALLAYSHNISLLIASLMTGFLFLLSFWFWDDKRKRFMALCKAAVTAVLLSLASLIPILEMTRTNTALNIPGGSGKILGETAFDLKTIVSDALRNRPNARGIGLFGILALIFLVLFCAVRLARKEKLTANKGIACFSLGGGLLFFAVSSILPWEQLGDRTILFWIQYVWRMNAWVALLLLAAFSCYLAEWVCAPRARIAVLAAVCVMAVFLHYSAFLALRQMDPVRLTEDFIASGDAVAYDYAPMAAKEYRSATGHEQEGILIDGREVPAEVSISRDGGVYTAVVDVPGSGEAPVSLDLPVFHYSQQECTLNGTRAESFMTNRGGTGLMVLPGQRCEVNIFYHYTPLARCAWVFSCAVLVLTVLSGISGLSGRRKFS